MSKKIFIIVHFCLFTGDVQQQKSRFRDRHHCIPVFPHQHPPLQDLLPHPGLRPSTRRCRFRPYRVWDDRRQQALWILGTLYVSGPGSLADHLYPQHVDHFPRCQGQQGHVQPEEHPRTGEGEEGGEPDDAPPSDRDLRVPDPDRSTVRHPMLLHDAAGDREFSIYTHSSIKCTYLLKCVKYINEISCEISHYHPV